MMAQQLQPVPDPQVSRQQIVPQAVNMTQPTSTIAMPQLPGVVEPTATPIAPRTSAPAAPAVVQPVSHWQSSPAAPQQHVQVQQVMPAEFSELSTELPTIEPY